MSEPRIVASPSRDTGMAQVSADESLHAEDNFLQQSKCMLSKLESLQDWIHLPENTKTALIALAGTLGKIISSDLFRDSQCVTEQVRNLSFDDDSTSRRDWLTARNPLLLAFLGSCTGISPDTESIKKINALVHAVEQVLYGKNLKCVSPFAFKRNMVAYSTTHSKLLTKLSGSWEPSGSYTTVNSILNQPCAQVDPPDNDIHVTFDNNQKVGFSSGRIREGSKVPVSICTATTFIEPQPPTNLQQKDDFTNDKWLSDKNNIGIKVKAIEDEAMAEFRLYRSSYIDEYLQKLTNDQEMTGPKDHIDLCIAQKALGQDNTVCIKCSYVYPKHNGTICPQCHHDHCHSSTCHDPYFRTPSRVPKEKPKVIVGDPCLVNSNSRKTVITVLHHIKEIARVPEQRKWVMVWSDGVPYIHVADIVENVYKCLVCHEEIDTKEVSLEDHSLHCNGSEPSTYQRVFTYVVPRPGPGHIEMNMAKVLLDVGWMPVLSHFATLLGFRSPKAQQVVKSGTNHHRSRAILSCMLEALTRELLLPYIKVCIAQKQKTSSLGFFQWIDTQVKNPNYHFLCDFTFTYLLAFHLYNEATRKSHSQRMLAARVAFAPLFYIRHHPIYQELHLRDLHHLASYPPELRQHADNSSSFSVSGLQNRAQGADFIQEEENKAIKSFLPPGMPSGETWMKVLRKIEQLKQMKTECLTSAGINTADTCVAKPVTYDLEIALLRREIRSNGLTSTPYCCKEFCSISGSPLDMSLAYFKETSRANYEQYKSHFVESGIYGHIKLTPVYFTKSERATKENIQHQTKVEIEKSILELIDIMPADEEALFFRNALRKLKNKKKDLYIALYNDVTSSLADQLANTAVGDMDNSDSEL